LETAQRRLKLNGARFDLARDRLLARAVGLQRPTVALFASILDYLSHIRDVRGL
jgi:hypothetical protein